jgi:hypothetical protein
LTGFYCGTVQILLGFCTFDDGKERIDGSSGDIQQTGAFVGASLKQILRYFTSSVLTARTELWLWAEFNTSFVALLRVCDEAENCFSIPLPLPNEVNFYDVGVIAGSVPGGWFRIIYPEVGDTIIPFDPSSFLQVVAYSLQSAGATAALRWDAIFPAHRQYTNYRGGLGEE